MSNLFIARYDISSIDFSASNPTSNIWRVSGTIEDPTGSFLANAASLNDKIIMRGYNADGFVVYDRYKITNIVSVSSKVLVVDITYEEPTTPNTQYIGDPLPQIVGNTPITGSFPIGSDLAYKNLIRTPSTYQHMIDPDYDAGMNSLNFEQIEGDNIDYNYWTLNSNTSNVYWYNWYAVTDSRNIANTGWHVPTKDEFVTLQSFLDPSGSESSNIAGGYMKDTTATYWDAPNTGATNLSGFNGRGIGKRRSTGVFLNSRIELNMFTVTSFSSIYAYGSALMYNTDKFVASSYTPEKREGLSVRLIKDTTILTNGQVATYTGNDGKTYQTICIGTQEWLSQDLSETKYRNTDLITIVVGDSEWSTLETEGACPSDMTNIYSKDVLTIIGDGSITATIENKTLTIASLFGNQHVQTLSGTTISWDVSSGINAILTISGDTVITISNLVVGTSGNITITNPSTVYTLTLAGYTNKISPGIYLTTNQVKISGSSKIDVFSWYYDGTYLIWNGTNGYN